MLQPKGGKGAAETPDVLSPFDSVEKSAVALAEYYSQGNFTAPRELYQGNECIVDVLENIIWVRILFISVHCFSHL